MKVCVLPQPRVGYSCRKQLETGVNFNPQVQMAIFGKASPMADFMETDEEYN